jgi:alanyl-tRNA synthetase
MPAWSSSRTFSPARRDRLTSAPRPRRNACAPAASITTSTTWATRRVITPFSRCSAIFSFGDYFKERAIELAWNLITKEFALAKERLLVTVYARDDEAFRFMGEDRRPAGLQDHRIGTSDNFWAMGDTGPCGPCSEIFYDHGEHIPGGPPGSPGEDGDRFIEIWNLVFMQYEQVAGSERLSLPRPSIDTGMGLERIAAVLQGVHDNYDIDLFRTLIAAIHDHVGAPSNPANQASPRVIADHLRATSFSDRRWRAAVQRGPRLCAAPHHAPRHAARSPPGRHRPEHLQACPRMVREMGQAYPELRRAEGLIEETLRLEERRFRTTLARGLSLLEEATGSLGEGDVLDGDTAFKLYDTYGFPLDLTQDALKSRGIAVDLDRFSSAMERQRAEARASWSGSGDAATETVWLTLRDRLGATEFLGYETETAEASVLAIVQGGEEVAGLQAGETGALVVNQTPFYGEAGGQVGDTGLIESEGGARFRVTDTQRTADGLFVHNGHVEAGRLQPADAVRLSVDTNRRAAIRKNHSATHLLHERCARRWGRMWRRKARSSRPSGCASTSRTPSRSPTRR